MKILPGIKGEISKVVDAESTAASFGSGLVDVFATPAMIALMENTALQSVTEYLSPNQNTVGIEICVKHTKATPVGMKVTCESVLTKVDGNKLYFDVTAKDEQGQIGRGTHTRFIIDTKEFMSKVLGG